MGPTCCQRLGVPQKEVHDAPTDARCFVFCFSPVTNHNICCNAYYAQHGFTFNMAVQPSTIQCEVSNAVVVTISFDLPALVLCVHARPTTPGLTCWLCTHPGQKVFEYAHSVLDKIVPLADGASYGDVTLLSYSDGDLAATVTGQAGAVKLADPSQFVSLY